MLMMATTNVAVQVCTGDAWVSQIVRNIVLRLPVTTDGSNPTAEDFANWEQRGIGTPTAHIFSPIFFLSYVLFITMILVSLLLRHHQSNQVMAWLLTWMCVACASTSSTS